MTTVYTCRESCYKETKWVKWRDYKKWPALKSGLGSQISKQWKKEGAEEGLEVCLQCPHER